MKNIHILSAGKPSRLYVMNIYKGLRLSKNEIDKSDINTPKNIYITSEEEIKEGDWTIYLGNLVKVASLEGKTFAKEYCKKIILTTEQELIKDGVQAIDDEFLQWFVKNPNCEEVEVSDYIKQIGWESDENGRDMILNKRFYEIIIPKKESTLKCELCKRYPRLEGTNKCESCYSVVRHVLEQDPRFKDNLLPDLRKGQETSSVGVGNQIFKIVLDEKCRPNKVSIIEADNNSVLKKQETLEKITEQIQNECHIFVESVPNVNYQDATNTFLFMKLANTFLFMKLDELTLKLKKYE